MEGICCCCRFCLPLPPLSLGNIQMGVFVHPHVKKKERQSCLTGFTATDVSLLGCPATKCQTRMRHLHMNRWANTLLTIRSVQKPVRLSAIEAVSQPASHSCHSRSHAMPVFQVVAFFRIFNSLFVCFLQPQVEFFVVQLSFLLSFLFSFFNFFVFVNLCTQHSTPTYWHTKALPHIHCYIVCVCVGVCKCIL